MAPEPEPEPAAEPEPEAAPEPDPGDRQKPESDSASGPEDASASEAADEGGSASDAVDKNDDAGRIRHARRVRCERPARVSAQGTAPLVIERLTVRADRVVCDVVLAPGVPRRTTPELAARVRAAHPHVPRHACVNDEGDTFAAVMDHTSLPHLLEHLVIDFQTRAAVRRGDGAEAGSAAAYADAGAALDAVFVGTTEWTDEAAGRARIEVSFLDDLVALRAFRDAIAFLGDAMVR